VASCDLMLEVEVNVQEFRLMADLISEDAEHTSAPETTELSGATLDRENAEPNKIAALMMSIWNAVMIACTMALFLMAMVLKDKSDATYATIGFIGLCIPQAVKIFKRMAEIKRQRMELEERLREAEIKRLRQIRERAIQAQEAELERLQQQEKWDQQEIAEQNALKNIDTASITPPLPLPGVNK
jgi:hypothetical protein